jgi:ParB-like chromosome segregation protein Spo0J
MNNYMNIRELSDKTVAEHKYQVMPDLTPEVYEALKSDIELKGVLVPIEVDEEGNILDGYHRKKICDELGIKDYNLIVRAGLTESEKRLHARKLNLVRRHLTRKQKREIIKQQLKETPEQSDRLIANSLGVSPTTVGTVRKEMEEAGELSKLDICVGADGKERPREVKRPPSVMVKNTTESEKVFDAFKKIDTSMLPEGIVDAKKLLDDIEKAVGKEYDESIANEVEVLECPNCGYNFPK